MVPHPSPFDQSSYQVRFEWGTDGLARLAPADLVVVVDVLRFSSTVIQALERGETWGTDAAARAASINGVAVAEAAEGTVLLGGLRNAAAVADAVLAEQTRRAARTSVSVIAAGERTSREPGAPVRFAVEDLFGAGAIIAALADRGIDHASPDAAAAAEAFRPLRGAMRHLLTASGSGRELADRVDEVHAAAAVDASTVVPVLSDGVFVAL